MTGERRERPPLCVDLDGTLIREDMLRDSVSLLARRRPRVVASAALALLRGRAAFKEAVARETILPVECLTYHRSLLALLQDERAAGRVLLLVTGSDQVDARRIADHLGIFDGVIASDGRTNVTGRVKARLLTARFGLLGFDYAGNSWTDLHVWSCARAAWVVSDDPGLVSEVKRVAKLERALSWC